ncbi:hypothetical protein ILYODFUR_011525 [Ilyodon furcidens]|uniref:Uncharacterized protein n=1 Tax=Ilyodon furcidens TaxID=33524 RepID=A0ABV0T897_9TELE
MKRTHLEAVEKPLFYIATLLDPRYKDGFFTKSANLSLAKEHLIQEVAIRAASAMPEEQGLQQSQRTRHDGVKHAASWTAPLRKSEKRGSHRPGPVNIDYCLMKPCRSLSCSSHSPTKQLRATTILRQLNGEK